MKNIRLEIEERIENRSAENQYAKKQIRTAQRDDEHTVSVGIRI